MRQGWNISFSMVQDSPIVVFVSMIRSAEVMGDTAIPGLVVGVEKRTPRSARSHLHGSLRHGDPEFSI